MRPSCRQLDAFSVVCAILAVTYASAAVAQSSKVEIVPGIPHFLPVHFVAFSSDGARIASASRDETVKLWDVATGHLIRTFEGHTSHVNAVAFSHDGAAVLSGSGNQYTSGATEDDRTLRLWNVTTGQLIRIFEGHTSSVNSVAFSPDGTRVLSGSGYQVSTDPARNERTLRLWDVTTGQMLRTIEGHQGAVLSVAFSPDGARIVSGSSDKTIVLWDATTGRLLRKLEGHAGSVNSVAFSPDGSRLLSGSKDKTLRLWDASTGQLLRSFEGHTADVWSVAFSPDGARALSGSQDRSLRLWDVATGQALHVVEAHAASVLSVRFSPDGAQLLSGSGEPKPKLWDAESGALLRTFEGHSDAVQSIALSPDGSRLAVAADRGIGLWDRATGQLVRTLTGHTAVVNAVTFSRDGRRLLSGSNDRSVKLWDPATGQLAASFEGHADPVTAVAFSPNGERFASGSATYTRYRAQNERHNVRVWDTATGRSLLTLQEPSGGIYSTAFSPDGTRLLTGADKGSVKLWDATTGKIVRNFEGSTSRTTAVAFSPDGTRVTSGHWDKVIRIWDAASGQLQRTLQGHSDPVQSIAISADGDRLLSGSWDGTLKLWDIGTGQLLTTLDGHASWVRTVAFAPDGNRVFSGGTDGTVRIWDPKMPQPLATLFGSRGGEWLAMTPAGFFASSDRSPKVLSIVRGVEVTSVAQVSHHLYRPDLVEHLLKGDPEHKYEAATNDFHLYKIFDSGPAPQIETIPERRGELVGDTVRLAARIVDTGGGIGDKVVWRVNGVTQGDVMESSPSLPGQSFRIVEQALRIDPSKRNVVELTVYNREGLLAALPLRFEVDRYITTEPRPKMHVLAIGVSAYADRDWQLLHAVTDAKAFAVALQEVAAPIYPKVNVRVLADSDVTTARLNAVFHALRDEIAAADVFVLFVAGHGRNASGTYYFLPQDFKLGPNRSLKTDAIGQDRWQAWLAMIPAQKSVLVFDTCESSGAVALSRGPREREAAMDRLSFATGRSVITAARQAAYEGFKGHGVLTYALLEALAKSEGKDELYLLEIAGYVNRKVPEFSQQVSGESQYPHSKIEGDFPIGVRIPNLSALVAEHIPDTPTHFVIRPELVRESASMDAQTGQELPPGTPVRVVEITGEWAVIARSGQKLGYVRLETLLGIRP